MCVLSCLKFSDNLCMGLHVFLFNSFHLHREIVNGQDGCCYLELRGVNMMPHFLILVR